MARGLSFIPLLASLAIGGWLLNGQLAQTPSPGTVTQALGQVREAAAGLTFVQAVTRWSSFTPRAAPTPVRRSPASR
jgi:hypothetical protein